MKSERCGDFGNKNFGAKDCRKIFEHRPTLDFYVEIRYYPSVDGFEMDAIAWFKTYELDAMVGLVEATEADAKLYPHLTEPLLPYGKFILALKSEEALGKVHGL